jgi:hypothetical protein
VPSGQYAGIGEERPEQTQPSCAGTAANKFRKAAKASDDPAITLIAEGLTALAEATPAPVMRGRSGRSVHSLSNDRQFFPPPSSIAHQVRCRSHVVCETRTGRHGPNMGQPTAALATHTRGS